MANPYRNEQTIKLGTTTISLRATFAAIAEIEAEYDQSIASLTIDVIIKGKATITMLKTILQIANSHSSKPIAETALEESMEEAGISEITKVTTEFLNQIFAGAPTSSKKATELTAKK
jgi:formate dehydrogenase maturation protein FdhE